MTQEDRDRATAIGRSIRALMVTKSTAPGSRPWWRTPSLATPSRSRIPSDLANAMSIDQRIALRAPLAGLAGQRSLDPATMAVTLDRADRLVPGEITASPFSPPDAMARTLLAPYLAVMRVMFMASDVELSAASPTVRFDYDQH